MLAKGLSKEEVELLEQVKSNVDSELWRELIMDIVKIKESKGELVYKKKWEMATKALTYLVTLYSQVIKEEVGLDAYYKISKEVWSEVGKSFTDLLKPLKIDNNDASSIHSGVRKFSKVIMGSELDFEVVEALKDRSVVRIFNCPWHQIMLETGMQSFCEPHHEIHEIFCQSLVKSINPHMTFMFTQHANLNSPYCEEKVEIRSSGAISP